MEDGAGHRPAEEVVRLSRKLVVLLRESPPAAEPAAPPLRRVPYVELAGLAYVAALTTAIVLLSWHARSMKAREISPELRAVDPASGRDALHAGELTGK